MRRTHIIELEAISGLAWQYIADFIRTMLPYAADEQSEAELYNIHNAIYSNLQRLMEPTPIRLEEPVKQEEDWL